VLAHDVERRVDRSLRLAQRPWVHLGDVIGMDKQLAAELWLAAERNYIPVRLLVVERDGTRYEQNATRISP